jgi:diguanylate cyclase (GGDEF)-like protein
MNTQVPLPMILMPAESPPSSAFNDTLTGLANRSLFNDRLEHGLALAKRHDLTLAVMFLDVDGFKAVNEVHGVDVGDALLQTVADRLRENTRDDDTVCRMEGDEFLYLVMGVNDTQTVDKLAREIVDCIQEPCELSVGTVNIKLSVGIARFPKDGDTAEALVKQAELAMHRAKRDQSEYLFAS